MEPGNAQNVRHDSPSAEIPTVDFERAAGVEQSPSQVPALPPPHPTTYCYRHNGLETVDGVEKVRPFIVEERGLFWPAKTNRSACEVWGFTTAGCSVHFIGGPKWNV
jgi:hypothetical protein